MLLAQQRQCAAVDRVLLEGAYVVPQVQVVEKLGNGCWQRCGRGRRRSSRNHSRRRGIGTGV